MPHTIFGWGTRNRKSPHTHFVAGVGCNPPSQFLRNVWAIISASINGEILRAFCTFKRALFFIVLARYAREWQYIVILGSQITYKLYVVFKRAKKAEKVVLG